MSDDTAKVRTWILEGEMHWGEPVRIPVQARTEAEAEALALEIRGFWFREAREA